MQITEAKPDTAKDAGKQYFVNIEGTEYPWTSETITTADIRRIGNIPPDQAIVEEDAEGRERTLQENETITLKPGHRHGRAPRYKRG